MTVKRHHKAEVVYEVYICGGRRSGTTTCTQGAVPRAAVDSAVLDYFERVGLDLDATRAELTERASQERGEIQALRGQAERQAAQAQERLDRVRRDYQDGRLEAEDWAEQRVQLQAELEAAQENAARLTEREGEATQAEGVLDDVELLTRLTELRAAVAGDVTASQDFAATHAALRRMFQAFILYPASRNIRHDMVVEVDGEEVLLEDVPRTGAYALEPVPYATAIVAGGLAGTFVTKPLALRPEGGSNASPR
jgi:hypothetical protein